MITIVLGKGETRQNYLLRVASAYIAEFNPEQTMIWDEAECDGYCLVDDIDAIIVGDYPEPINNK